jgi:hypothetical protein
MNAVSKDSASVRHSWRRSHLRCFSAKWRSYCGGLMPPCRQCGMAAATISPPQCGGHYGGRRTLPPNTLVTPGVTRVWRRQRAADGIHAAVAAWIVVGGYIFYWPLGSIEYNRRQRRPPSAAAAERSEDRRSERSEDRRQTDTFGVISTCGESVSCRRRYDPMDHSYLR